VKRLTKSLHPLLLIAAMALVIAGCAGRRPVAGSQPPPLTPSPAPSESGAGAKASTGAEPGEAPIVSPGRASRVNPAAPIGFTQVGDASWYGEEFNGKRSSDGEIYDMNKFTAAHRTLPFNSMVRVTNLNNDKSTIVRITDRGPFVANRIIDLSRAAAEEIGAVGPGVVPVRLEVISGSNPTAGFFTVQVGAFLDENNAERLREQLSASYSPVFIQQVQLANGTFYRVRVGKISGEQAAEQLGDELRTNGGFTPFVVRLDEDPAGGANR
jgi:peptidoglycan lytic transglycosylase